MDSFILILVIFTVLYTASTQKVISKLVRSRDEFINYLVWGRIYIYTAITIFGTLLVLSMIFIETLHPFGAWIFAFTSVSILYALVYLIKNNKNPR